MRRRRGSRPRRRPPIGRRREVSFECAAARLESGGRRLLHVLEFDDPRPVLRPRRPRLYVGPPHQRLCPLAPEHDRPETRQDLLRQRRQLRHLGTAFSPRLLPIPQVRQEPSEPQILVALRRLDGRRRPQNSPLRRRLRLPRRLKAPRRQDPPPLRGRPHVLPRQPGRRTRLHRHQRHRHPRRPAHLRPPTDSLLHRQQRRHRRPRRLPRR
mmetsp:Transcript_36955/g.118451  ORF Transcript_36955/g.118451 Transcript_36955/m.118451 type:complete len:211 (-) Transcript_36955:292-924(-)